MNDCLSVMDRLFELVMELVPIPKPYSLMDRVVRAGDEGIPLDALLPEGRLRAPARVWLFQAVRRDEVTVAGGRVYLTREQRQAYEGSLRREAAKTEAEARILTQQTHERRQAIFEKEQESRTNSEEAQAAAALRVSVGLFAPRRLPRGTLPAPLFLTTYGDPPRRMVRCGECGRDVEFNPGVRATLQHESYCNVTALFSGAAAATDVR